MRPQPSQDAHESADLDPIHEAATEWLLCLRQPNLSLEETLAWQAWMKQDARHAAAFGRMEELLSWLQDVKRPPRPVAADMGNLEGEDYDASQPVRTWLDARKPGRARRPRGVSRALAASVIFAAMALGWVATKTDLLHLAGSSLLETTVGENRSVTLRDGSTVTLGGATRVRVQLGERMRWIELERGEAFFAVAHDATRPFKVHAGNAVVVAVGTEFNVRRGIEGAVVSVIEGVVNVEASENAGAVPRPADASKRSPVRVAAGEGTVAGSSGVQNAKPLPDTSSITSWRSGLLAFRLQPLQYVLEDVNRYSEKPIIVEDEALRSSLFTGTVAGNNVRGWVSSLQSAMNLEATEEESRIVLRRRSN